jgi:hypothetical protein
MTIESEFLLTTLRCGGIAAPAAIDWPELLELADSHGVLTLFCKRYSGELPEPFVSRVHSQWIAAAYLTSELEGLLEQFSLHSLEVLPLKGPLLAQVLYGSPGLRRSDDLDLLVQRQDFCKAQSLLIDLGFEPDYQTDDYHQSALNCTSQLPLPAAPRWTWFEFGSAPLSCSFADRRPVVSPTQIYLFT